MRHGAPLWITIPVCPSRTAADWWPVIQLPNVVVDGVAPGQHLGASAPCPLGLRPGCLRAWCTSQVGVGIATPPSLQLLACCSTKQSPPQPLGPRNAPAAPAQVVLAASQMLGALSPLRLASITQRWAAELGKLIRADASSPARQLLYDLCHGMRFVRLAGGTPAQLEASAEFLRVAHPLTHVAPDKKSRVQQAICDMLAGVLQPLADGGDPE